LERSAADAPKISIYLCQEGGKFWYAGLRSGVVKIEHSFLLLDLDAGFDQLVGLLRCAPGQDDSLDHRIPLKLP
jgi:hypothetical protein